MTTFLPNTSRNTNAVTTEWRTNVLIDRERQQIQEIQAGLASELDSLRGTQGLAPRERQRRMARAVLSARASLSEVREASDEREAGEQRKAYTEAFGIDPGRAAEERTLRRELAAGSPRPVEVRDSMEEALRIGDDLAAKVLAAYSWDHRNDEIGSDAFRGILNAYADSSPEATRLITNVATFDASTGHSGEAKLQRLGDKLLTEVPQPHDLPGNLDYLAADDGPPAQASGMPWGA